MQRELPSSRRYYLAFRIAGLFIWSFLALPAFGNSTRSGETLSAAQWTSWLILFFTFGLAFLVSSAQSMPAAVRIPALVAETVCVLGMTALFRNYLVGFLLVVISWQVALVLPIQVAILWVIADSALWVFFQEPHFHMGWRWGATGALFGLQAFALTAAAMARSEANAHHDLARTNAELVSTRELLRESSKAGERIRIARDLHDALGHRLTALCLHLEAAMHSREPESRAIVGKALETSKQALTDIRSVVSQLSGSETIDLRQALQSLADHVPRVSLHLALPGSLHITDSSRAQAVVRCVQEITTNTLKHSDAQNLWITLETDQGAIAIDAHDDGRTVSTAQPGTGISSMRKRLEELGGGLDVDASGTRGFRLRAWLPLRGTMEAR